MRLTALLLLLMACAYGHLRREPRPGDEATKIVTEVLSPPTYNWWRSSKWYRPGQDTTLPSSVFISGLWACILYTPDVNEPRVRDYYRCPTGWRPPGASSSF